MERPTRARQVFRLPTTAHLHDCDSVSLFREPMGAHAATEPGPDDDEVEIELRFEVRHRKRPSGWRHLVREAGLFAPDPLFFSRYAKASRSGENCAHKEGQPTRQTIVRASKHTGLILKRTLRSGPRCFARRKFSCSTPPRFTTALVSRRETTQPWLLFPAFSAPICTSWSCTAGWDASGIVPISPGSASTQTAPISLSSTI